MSDFVKNKPDQYYNELDKRSKEYKSFKQWKQEFDNQNALGIGDVVENITKATGIKKVVKFIAGDDCGCDKRKEALNNIPFRFPVVRCFTEEQYNQWGEYKDKTKWSNQDQIEVLIPIYAQLFARAIKPCSCNLSPYVDEINKVYDKYQ